MVNDESRTSHDFWDELRGKLQRVGVYASERLSFTVAGRPLGDSQGQNRNREIRLSGIVGGASGNVAMVEMRTHLVIERARLVTLHLKQARRSSIPTGVKFPGPTRQLR